MFLFFFFLFIGRGVRLRGWRGCTGDEQGRSWIRGEMDTRGWSREFGQLKLVCGMVEPH